uniref:Patched domain containing 3/pseudo n=1 Tax=Scleropages formosus TaxID=113540 RepID=A0A8C9VBS8_SCLFO
TAAPPLTPPDPPRRSVRSRTPREQVLPAELSPPDMVVACHTDCVEKPISVGFQRFGRFVGRKPWWFLLLPLLSSLALAGGFCFLEEREANDIEEQFTPVDGAAKLERRFVRENFPQDDSRFSSQRLYTDGVYASFIAVSRSPANVLTRAAFEEIILLDRRVKEIEVYGAGGRGRGRERLSFGSLCAARHGECVSNAILDVINHDGGRIEETRLTFPFSIFGLNSVFLGHSVGGVVVRNASVLSSARAIRLFYFLKEEDESKAAAWLAEFLRVFPSNLSRLDFIEVTHATSLSRQVEFEANSKDVIPLFSITYVISISFSVVSCLRFDCVRNKVWVAAFGVMSAGLAVLSSFGMMLYIATFLHIRIRIGVDDMFILISCWQQTNVHDKVEDRLADTYKEAAISITITTLTDVLAFYIGLMTPFRSVRSFCLYSSTNFYYIYYHVLNHVQGAKCWQG